MIIDAHGHYTTVPSGHRDFRARQLAWLSDPSGPRPAEGTIGDDEIRESIENNQLKALRERGEDLMLISPQASAMEHHVPDPLIAVDWARSCNDLVHRVTGLFPAHFAAVCQLPQTPGGDLAEPIAELRRCVSELGFVGCNVSPDPSGGHWTSPPMTDPYWFPLYEALVEGDLFGRFPTLRLVIPHGGGAVPYHWGRYRGLADRLGQPEPRDHVLPNVFFDSCVYHQAGIDLLFEVIPADNILFASEMIGAVRGIDPETGFHWDDTKRYVDALGLGAEEQRKVFELNARRVYPRLDARLTAAGR